MIDAFTFGSITVAGKTYHSDVIIYPGGRVEDNWRRKKGHRLTLLDILPLINAQPEIIIAGTGVDGRMEPDTALEPALASRKIRLFFARNEQAVQLYNQYAASHSTGACFHLTC